jgi:transposase
MLMQEGRELPMPNKQYTVDLSEEERAELESFISSGIHKAEDITRARILLKADDGATDAEISHALDCGQSTPYRARKRYADRGIAAIHRRNPDRDYQRKLDGEDEAHLIALATSEPPDGRARWTLRLLADEFVVLEEIDHESVSYETVRQVLKKTNYSLTDPNNG